MRWTLTAAGVLLAIFFFQELHVSGLKSPAADEPGHIAGGVAQVQLGTLAVNPQHPPLLKALAGLSLTAAGVRWPDTREARVLLAGDPLMQWPVGSTLLMSLGVDRALAW